MGIADIRWQRVPLMQFRPRTFTLLSRGSPLLGLRRLPASIAPLGIHELSVNSKVHVIAVQIVPEKTCARIVHVRLIVVQGVLVGDLALEIIRALFASVSNLPGLLVVIGSNRRRGPDVAVARDFSTVIEIIEYPELQREFVLVGSDVLAVHGQRRIAIAEFQIA